MYQLFWALKTINGSASKIETDAKRMALSARSMRSLVTSTPVGDHLSSPCVVATKVQRRYVTVI